MGVFGAAIALASVLHIGVGKVSLSPQEVWDTLQARPHVAFHTTIVWDLRLPSTLIALVAGGMMGLAGAILQAILRNPLAEPGTVAVTAGAVLAIVSIGYITTTEVPPHLLPVLALVGAVPAAAFAYAMSVRQGRVAPGRLILMGVLVSAVLLSITQMFIILGGPTADISSYFFWVVGSLNGRVWPQWEALWPWALALVPIGLATASLANAVQLGEDVATGMGLRVERVKLLLFGVAILLTSAAVSAVGGLTFIGLLGPHIARRLVGSDARLLFPLSTLIASALLVSADVVTQVASIKLTTEFSAGIPVGATTALMGAPFLLYLLLRRSTA
jgi:iron complex transport system permease protein